MKLNIFFVLSVLVLIGSGAWGTYYFHSKYNDSQQLLQNPEIAAQQEVDALTAKISAFFELPSDEEPSVATVLEKDKLKDQPFFAKAEDGDKVIIYTKAMKAILYRPSINKVIEVMPISINQPADDSLKEVEGDESSDGSSETLQE